MKKKDSTKAIKAIIKTLCVLMLSLLMITPALGTNIHHYSNSWVGADTFAKYMGVGFTTKSHKTFSSNSR